MKNKNIGEFITILVILLCQVSYTCASDQCDELCEISSGSPTLPIPFVCGVCGVVEQELGMENTCNRDAFYSKIYVNETKCVTMEDHCDPSYTYYQNKCNDTGKEGTGPGCEELYCTEVRCGCNEGYFGNHCTLKKQENFVESSDGWAMFDNHQYKWKSRLFITTLFLAQIEKFDQELPVVTYRIRMPAAVYLPFTKYRKTLTEDNYKSWCLTSTSLREYCTRFNLIFDPKYHKGEKVKHIFYYNSEVPMYDEDDKDTKYQLRKFYYDNQMYGYTGDNRVDVWNYFFDPTYFPVTAGIIKKVTIYRNDDTASFINYTTVDRTCVPRFHVAPGCTDLRNAASTYYVSENIAVTMIYKRPPPVCEESVFARWRCWKVAYDVLREEGSEDLSYDGCCTWIFPKHTLWEGVYTVQFRMKHFKGGETFTNIKGCLIRVELRPLQGGFTESEKYVNTEDVNLIQMDVKDINRDLDLQRADFEYTWSCTCNENEDICPDVPNYFQDAPAFKIPKYVLKVNWTYHLTVRALSKYLEGREVKSIQHQLLAHLILSVGTQLEPIALICLSCDDYSVMSSTELNYVAVRAVDGKSQPTKINKYVWDYGEENFDGSVEYKPIDIIRETNGTSRLLLKIKKNSLEYGKTYVFRARVPDSPVYATTKVRTSPFKFKLECTISPDHGVRGWTNFSVDCLPPPKDELVLYEFYDKDEDDQLLFSGRMLGYDTDGKLEQFKMTKGKLVVLFYDSHNAISKFDLKVELTPYNDTLEYLRSMLLYAEDMIKSGVLDRPTSLVSSIADVIDVHMGPKPENIRRPLLVLRQVPFRYLPPVKMCLSSFKVILINIADKFESLQNEADLVYIAAQLLMTITLQFLEYENNIRVERTLTQTTYLQIMKAMLDCIEILLLQKNREVRSKPYEYVNPLISDLVYETYAMLISNLEIISFSFDRQQIEGDQAEEVVTRLEKIISVTKVDFLDELSNWTMTSNESSVVLFPNLLTSTGGSSDIVGLQYMRLRMNPFWWAGGNIVTEVLFIHLCLKRRSITCHQLSHFSQRISLHLNVTEPLESIKEITGTTYQPNSQMRDEDLDLALTVYRFFLPPRAKLFLKFIINETEEYRVLLEERVRPNYATVVKNAVIINSSSPDYDLIYDSKHDYKKIYYMGILPSEKVSTGFSVPFRLKAFYTVCSTWATWQWTSYGCWIGEKTDESSIQCDCDHLSLVAGALATPDHDHNPAWEFLLYLTPWDNLLPLLILILLLFLFLLLLILGLLKDRKDRTKGEVIILDDNFPGERYAYLIGVYTGSRLFSGTSAFIGIRIYGEFGESRPHILRSSERSVTNAFSEDWFLLYCQRSLGNVEHILVWHNNEGFNPDWFVDKIEIYDLDTKLEYIFEIKNWIGIEVDSYPTVSVVPLKVHKFFAMRNVFHYNFVSGLRDTNNWTSTCLKHPRNPVTRVERISVVLCFILVAMAVSLLLYLSYFGFDIDEDRPSYYFSYTDLLIFILSFLAASVVACIIMGLFRKSFTHNYKMYMGRRTLKRSQASITVHSPRYVRPAPEEQFFVMDESELRRYRALSKKHVKVGLHRLTLPDKPRYKRTTCENCVMALYKITRGNLLLPLKLPGHRSDLIVRKPWFFAAWALCILTIVISTIIVFAFAWKLPTVKNEKFLSMVLAVILFDVIIVSFLKILLSSAILSYMFQHLVPATTYHIKPKDGARRHLIGNIPFLANLLEVRSQSIYNPLSVQFIDKKMTKRVRLYRWRILVDFLVVIVLILLVLIICEGYAANQYQTNSHVTRMTTSGHKRRAPSLKQSFNRTEFNRFLQYTYVNQIFRYMWYNFEPLCDPGDCEASSYFQNLSGTCAPAWSNDAEDKDVYSTGWLLGDYKDTTRKITTWRYVPPELSNSSRFYGKSCTMYHGGGYIAELGYIRRQTRVFLSTLEKVIWLDHMTRALFVELNLYNVNTDLFTQVVLIAEQEPTGEYITTPKVDSVKTEVSYNFWEVGFTCFLLFFLCRMLYSLNRRGLFVYFSNKLHKYEVFLLTLGFGTIIFHTVHIKTSSYYVQQFQRGGLDEFFSFFEIIKFYILSKCVMCFFFFSIVMKLLLSWKFGDIFFSFYHTLLLSLSWMIWLTLSFIVFLVIMWRLIAYHLNVYLFSFCSFIIIYPKDLSKITVHEGGVADIVVYLMCIASSCTILLFVASYAHYYRIGKCYMPFSTRYVDHFNYILFLKDEIMNLRKKGRKDKKNT